MPTPQLSKTKKRLPRKREGWLRRQQDFKRGKRWRTIESNPSSITLPSIDFYVPPCLVPHHRHRFQSLGWLQVIRDCNAGLGTVGPSQIQLPFQKIGQNTQHCCLHRAHANTGCPFKVNATYSVVKECVTVVAVEEEQNCMGIDRAVERSSIFRHDWLQRVSSCNHHHQQGNNTCNPRHCRT